MVRSRAYDAVLFDWCGTLVGYRWVEDRVAMALATLGRDVVVAAELAERIRAVPADPELSAAEAGCDLSAEHHRRAKLARYERADLDEELAVALEATYGDLTTYDPYPEVPDVIVELTDGGCEVVIVSDFHVDLRPHFERLGVLDRIAGFAISCEVGATKPAPEMFEAALAHVDADPGRCLMVGDNPGPDTGAVALGITTLIVPFVGEGRPELIRQVPRLVFDA